MPTPNAFAPLAAAARPDAFAETMPVVLDALARKQERRSRLADDLAAAWRSSPTYARAERLGLLRTA